VIRYLPDYLKESTNTFVLRKRRVLFVVPLFGGMKADQAPPEGGTTNNGCGVTFLSDVSKKDRTAMAEKAIFLRAFC